MDGIRAGPVVGHARADPKELGMAWLSFFKDGVALLLACIQPKTMIDLVRNCGRPHGKKW